LFSLLKEELCHLPDPEPGMGDWQGKSSKVRVNAIPAFLRRGSPWCWVRCFFLPSSFPQIKLKGSRSCVLKKGDPHFREAQIFELLSPTALNLDLSCCCRAAEDCTAHLFPSSRARGAQHAWEDLSIPNPADRGSSCCPSQAELSLDETLKPKKR